MAQQKGTEEASCSALANLAEAAQQLDTRAYEERDADTCRRELVPRVDTLLADSITLAQAFFDQFAGCDPSPPPPGSFRESLRPERAAGPVKSSPSPRPPAHFPTQMDALVNDAARGPALVADIAFVAGLELREKRQRVARSVARMDADHWEIIEACASARRRVIKSVTALELVLSEVQGRAPGLDYRTELTVALEVRRRYAALRKTIASNDPPNDASLLPRLRVIGTRIAMLVGLDVYPDLRLRDRVLMRTLQGRILRWLGGEQDAREGTRLWCDLVGFADLIAQVRRRQELLEYDASVRERLLEQLSTSSPDASLEGGQLTLLRSLRGASDTIDALLDADERSVTAWTDALETLCHGAGDGAPDWPDAPASTTHRTGTRG